MSLASLLEEGLRAELSEDKVFPNRLFSFDDSELAEDIELPFLLEATNGKVSTFLVVFSSMLTQYDQQLSKGERKRGRSNIYRLGHYLDALDRARAQVQGVINDDSKEAVAKLRDAIASVFHDNDNPGKKLLKVIDAYIEKGTLPKIQVSKETKAKIAAEKKAAKGAPADMPMAAESLAYRGVLITERLIELPAGQSKVEALEAAIEKSGGSITVDASGLANTAKRLKKALSSKDDRAAKEELTSLLRAVEYASWATLGRTHATSKLLKKASDALLSGIEKADE